MNNRTATEWRMIIDEHSDHAGDGKWLEELVCDVGHRIPEWDFKEVVQ